MHYSYLSVKIWKILDIEQLHTRCITSVSYQNIPKQETYSQFFWLRREKNEKYNRANGVEKRTWARYTLKIHKIIMYIAKEFFFLYIFLVEFLLKFRKNVWNLIRLDNAYYLMVSLINFFSSTYFFLEWANWVSS